MASLEIRENEVWCIEPEGTWLYETLPAILTANKYNILADGVDAATITAEVPQEVTEVTYINAETNEVISTLPKDIPLQFTTTTAGIYTIRVGEPTMTKYNQIIIYAE